MSVDERKTKNMNVGMKFSVNEVCGKKSSSNYYCKGILNHWIIN